MARFAGQVAMVTGASSGIGAGLARELARRGAAVVLLGRREERLDALAQELGAQGRRALAVRCDVTRDGDLEQAVDRARRELGRIDVVVANAGFGVAGPLDRLTLDDYRRQFETNVFGVLRTIYATLDALKASRGRLLIVGSISSYLGVPGSSAYVMSKFAVRGLAESIVHELAPFGVSVTLVNPGFVASEIRQIDNRGVYRQGRGDRAPRWLVVPTDRAVREIVTALARRRPQAVVTGHARILVFLQRHVPWLIAWTIRRARIAGRREPDAAKGAGGRP